MREFKGEAGMSSILDIFQKTILCALVGCVAIPVNILGMSLAKRNWLKLLNCVSTPIFNNAFHHDTYCPRLLGAPKPQGEGG
jgi:hypothetical protein